MTVLLLGANPCLTLYDAGRAVAFASVWRVDWSERGAGLALVVGDAAGVRILGPDPGLGRWLAGTFNRHFADVLDGLPWAEPETVEAPVDLRQDLAAGLEASCADVRVELAGPLDRRPFRTGAYDLGGVPTALSNVYIPCRSGSITVGGVPVAGAPQLSGSADRPSSTAFLAEAEVWTRV